MCVYKCTYAVCLHVCVYVSVSMCVCLSERVCVYSEEERDKKPVEEEVNVYACLP